MRTVTLTLSLPDHAFIGDFISDLRIAAAENEGIYISTAGTGATVETFTVQES